MIGASIKDSAGPSLEGMAKSLPTATARGVLAAAQETEGILRREVYSTFQGRTGGLARSFKATFLGYKGTIVSAGVFSKSVYADIQDQGGRILPKNGKKLAVPLPGANIPIGKWPRDFGKDQLVFIKRKGGRAPILAKVTKNRVTPMFALMSSITIRGRHYIDAAAAKATPKIEEIVGREIAVDIERGEK
jgi:Family of unknown function (DUF6441)